MSSTGITSCTLNKATNILTITLAFRTTSLTITFTVASIRNPLYAKTTEAIRITTLTTANVEIDSSSGTYTVTPTPGNLEVTLTSTTSRVGVTEALKFSLALTNPIGADGKIHIFLPKWNPESPSPQSIFSAGNPSCLSILNVNPIVCTFTTNVDTGNTQDKILISGAFTATATTIEFSITNYRNPPSTKPMTAMQVHTTTTTEANVLDEDTSIALVMTQAAILPSATITVTPTDTKINKSTTYTFNIRVFNPLPVGTRIRITFPTQITPTSTSLTALGTGKLNTLIVTDYVAATKVLTLTEVIISQSSYVNSGEYIQFSLSPITNPSATSPSGSFTIQTFEGVDYSIETVTTGVTVTATTGEIKTFTVSPENTRIRERTLYTFTFVTENDVPVGSSITIIFPTQIAIEDRTSTACVSGATGISSTNARCTVTSTSRLVITGGFPTTAIKAGNTISFKVNSVLNGNTVEPTSNFQAEFLDSTSFAIDRYKNTDVKVTFVVNTLQDLVINPTLRFTGVQTTYTITVTVAADKTILRSSVIRIVFPSEIIISNPTSSAAS